MSGLSKIALRVSGVAGRIVLARFGNDPNLALETRDAQNEFWQALVQFAFDGKMPEIGEAVKIEFGGGDEQFLLRLERRSLDEEHSQ